MLLSTIFKRGTKDKEQCTGKLFCDGNSVCALGGIAIGAGIVTKAHKENGKLTKEALGLNNSLYPKLRTLFTLNSEYPSYTQIYAENDNAKLSFKEIYNWLRGIEKEKGIKNFKLS